MDGDPEFTPSMNLFPSSNILMVEKHTLSNVLIVVATCIHTYTSTHHLNATGDPSVPIDDTDLLTYLTGI